MVKIKKMMTGASVTFLCGMTVFVSGNTCQAAGESYSTALEASYGDTFRSVYENRLAGSPLEAEEIDGVDTATGHLMLSRNDLSLDGTGGMDFELNRYYDSNEANLGHATVEYIEQLEVDTLWVNYTASDGSQRRIVVNAAVLKKYKNALKNLLVKYEKGDGWKGVSFNGKKHYENKTQRTKIVSNEGHNVYGLASGWRYDFPWIEEVSEKQYYVTDPHGNVVQLTDESGKVTKTYEYDSFGNEVKPDGKDDNLFRYCGEYYDKETEEIYLQARYCQPAVGRFLTRDTYTEEDESLSLHLYAYCEYDGVNSIDSSGYQEEEKYIQIVFSCRWFPIWQICR